MLTKNISFKNFKVRKNTKKIKNDLKLLIKENNSIIKSLSPYYKNNYSKKLISKFLLTKFNIIREINNATPRPTVMLLIGQFDFCPFMSSRIFADRNMSLEGCSK